MRIRTFFLAGLLIGLVGLVGGVAEGKPKKLQSSPTGMPVPNVLTAHVVLRDSLGKVIRRMSADTTNGQSNVVALCVYAPQEPMPDTLAFVVTVGEAWQLHTQIKQAMHKPTLDGVTLLMGDEGRSITSWTAGAKACRIRIDKFDGQDVDATLECSGVGGDLGSVRTLEAKFHVEACAKL